VRLPFLLFAPALVVHAQPFAQLDHQRIVDRRVSKGVPIASTAWGANATGICAGVGVDANGCIAVYGITGSDP
jgi:hypothetical protein